jgi:ferredoxin
VTPDAERLAKQRRAAAHPDRPGERCSAPAGTFRPVVDHSRCEGKRDCIDVCPNDVFEVRRIDDTDYLELRSVRGGLPRTGHRPDPPGLTTTE